MNYKPLIAAVALIVVFLVVPFASAAPKAYDTIFYKGKAAGLKILFEFGHFHVEASNVKITESASGKTTRFFLTGRDGQMGTGKIRFAPVKGDKAKKEVLLEMDPFGDPPSTVRGTYTAGGKTVSFTLTKRKKHRTAQHSVPVRETLSAFHPRAQQNPFGRGDGGGLPSVPPASQSLTKFSNRPRSFGLR